MMTGAGRRKQGTATAMQVTVTTGCAGVGTEQDISENNPEVQEQTPRPEPAAAHELHAELMVSRERVEELQLQHDRLLSSLDDEKSLRLDMHTKVVQLEADLKQTEADNKRHKEACMSQAANFAALTAKFNEQKNDLDLRVARLLHVRKMIEDAESAYFKQATTQDRFDANGWRESFQRLLGVVFPLFAQFRE